MSSPLQISCWKENTEYTTILFTQSLSFWGTDPCHNSSHGPFVEWAVRKGAAYKIRLWEKQMLCLSASGVVTSRVDIAGYWFHLVNVTLKNEDTGQR